MRPAKDHTDAHAVRFFTTNDRICDRAHRDESAGLHKHAVETYENRGIIVCVCCGVTREERPEDAGQWYMVHERHGGTRHGTFFERRT
jgi:hypothetical protein